jgi:hypothetical protein
MLNDLIYKELVPYASYMQFGWIFCCTDEEGRPHGFSSEVAIAALTVIIIGSFFKNFFGEFGKLAAKEAFESLVRRIKRSDGHEPCVTELNVLIELTKDELTNLDSNRLPTAIDRATLDLNTELQNAGLPERKTGKIANECIKIILKVIL